MAAHAWLLRTKTRTTWTFAAAALVLMVVIGAVAASQTAGASSAARIGSGVASRPYLVAPSCERTLVTREACRVAVRYLRSLDLDRFEPACRLLAHDTLENAGGIEGCVSSLRRARGIRIRYGIHEAAETPLGASVRFRTKSIDGTGSGTKQTMVVRLEQGEPRIWLVATTP